MCYNCGTDDESYDETQDKCRSCVGFLCCCEKEVCLICQEQKEKLNELIPN